MEGLEFDMAGLESKVFNLADPRNVMILAVAKLIHEDKWIEAGSFYTAYVNRTKGTAMQAPLTKDKVMEVMTQLLHWCLNNDRYEHAARLLWTENLFDPRPHFTQLIWGQLKTNAQLMLMGSASASKSYSTGAWLLLDWIRDPENTSVKLLGPSEQHLNEQLFSHLINMHQQASIPLPGEVGDRWIGVDRRNKFGSISGVVVPLGKKAAGRLQGAKAGRRKKPHPIFGVQRRLRVFMDESEKIPEGIWKDVSNIVSNLDGVETFKIICAFNPENQNGESGTRCEPVGGWQTFNIDTDEVWRSKRGWMVVRLDAFKGENIIHRTKIFPGLQAWEGLNTIIENGGGYNSPAYYTMARAAFPPSGVMVVVIPQGMAEKAKATFIFKETPVPFGAADLALEGGASIPFALGEFGYALGYRKLPTPEHPLGEVVDFRNKMGDRITRPALQLSQLFQVETGDTPFVAKKLIELCQKLFIKPEHMIVDRTGNGAGVHDTMRNDWSPLVMGVNYMEGASETKILEEDLKTCKELYDRVKDELWFALRKWMEFKFLLMNPGIDYTKLLPQLTTRQYTPGKLDRVESKPEYKKRNGGVSPDEADTAGLLVHVVRKAMSAVPNMALDVGADGPSGGPPAGMSIDEWMGIKSVRVDVTNRLSDDGIW